MGVDITPSTEQIIRYLVLSVLGGGLLYAALIAYVTAKRDSRVLWVLAVVWTAGLGTLWRILLQDAGTGASTFAGAAAWESYLIAAIPTIAASFVVWRLAKHSPQRSQGSRTVIAFLVFVGAAPISFLLIQGW